MDIQKQKRLKLEKRKLRVRSKLYGTENKPRLSIFRSNLHIYAQLINDDKKVTICAASDKLIKKGTPISKANEVGKMIAKLSLEKKISEVVFDRGGYRYHGRVKSLADGAREAGLKF